MSDESDFGIEVSKNSYGYGWKLRISDYDIEALEVMDLTLQKKFGNLPGYNGFTKDKKEELGIPERHEGKRVYTEYHRINNPES